MNRQPPRFVAALLLLALPVAAQYAGERRAEANIETAEPLLAIDPRRLDAHLRFLASDALGGRDTGTVGGDVASEYIASVFRGLGLEPAGEDGEYLQHFPLVSVQLNLESVVCELRGEGQANVRRWVLDEEFALSGQGAAGLEREAALVFVGHGLVNADAGRDDYRDVDVTGRFAVVLAGSPSGRGSGAGASWRARRAAAREHGAAGIVFLTPSGDAQAEQGFKQARDSMRRRSMGLPGGDEASFPRLSLSASASRELLALAGRDLEAEIEVRREAPEGQQGFLLPGLTISLRAAVDIDESRGANVAGLLAGSHAQFGHEVVVLSAHLDHVGTDAEGRIFHGADDNASGTTALLLAAEGLVARGEDLGRSVLFLAVAGEEKGLLGSEWWVAHPTVDLGHVVANVNIDMVGRNEPFAIGATPSPTHEQYNSLVPLAVSLGSQAGLEVLWEVGEGSYRRRVDEYFSRSDHVNFANAGIPVLFLFSGEHVDYHEPSDTVDKIDQGKVSRVTDLVGRLIREVANEPQRPARIE